MCLFLPGVNIADPDSEQPIWTLMSKYKIYNKDCYPLSEVLDNSVDALITDPPYGISYQNNHWDKNLPDRLIWKNALRVMKPGALGLVFSAVRLMHRMMVDMEDSGFVIKDVLFWSYLNGMPKSKDVALSIDKEMGVESKHEGTYKYVQGYRKDGANTYTTIEGKQKKAPASKIALQYKGAGLGLKPAYEPIILIQKPIEESLTVAQNIIKYGTGALNLEETRIPYEANEDKVGHNPHPKGRVAPNIIRTEPFEDGYDKFFLVPKVRQHAEDFNKHPTLKPVALMAHLVKLISWKEQRILDPFMGSGSTGVAAIQLERNFSGFEIDEHYFEIAKRRLVEAINNQE